MEDRNYQPETGRMITGEPCPHALERMGFEPGAAEEMPDSFIKAREKEGVGSEVWVPARFQERVINVLFDGRAWLPVFEYGNRGPAFSL
jgi:hypothetical protein